MSKRKVFGADRVPWSGRRDYLGEKIARRWKEWAPMIRVSQLGGVSVANEALHRAAVLCLLRAGLAMRDIRRTRLDNPTLTPKERNAKLAEYVERTGRIRATIQRKH